MPDFWRMVWQERASCIVMVTRTFDFIRVMCVQYWPAAKNREEVYGGVGVTVETEEQLANFMIRYETFLAPLRWDLKESQCLSVRQKLVKSTQSSAL